MTGRKRSMSGQTALITGASGGIGEHLARQFAEAGFDLVLVARREDRLRALAEEFQSQHAIKAQVIPADLADPSAPASVLARVQESGTAIDALVNNAGFAVNGPFAETPEQRELDLLQVNIASLVHLTKRCLPPMLERRRGWILNLASTAAFLPGPLMATYYASKAFVLSFSEALAMEVEGTGVSVTALCPAATETEFAQVAGMQGSRLFQGAAMTAEFVARAGYNGLIAGRRVVVPGLKNRLAVQTGRFLPRRFLASIARSFNGPA